MRAALRIPGVARLGATYTGNELADWLGTITLAVLVYDQTGNALATTLLFLCTKFLPGLLVPALAARAERLPTGRMLAGLYVVEAGAFVALALSASSFSLALICTLAFFDGTLAATARAVTRGATVALLAPAGQLREGNAALNIGFATMNVGAPAAAGFLVAAFGAPVVLALAAAVFLALAVVMATARRLPAGTADEAPWTARLREGSGYVVRQPLLRMLIVGQAAVLLLATMVVPIEVVYAKESLGAGDAGFGALVTAWGVGLVLGSLAFARFRDARLRVVLLASTLLIGLGYLGMAAAPGLAAAMAAAVLGGLGNGMQWVALVTAVQEAVSDDLQARVAGFLEAVVTGVPGLGFVLGGALTAALNPRVAFAVSGAGVALLALAGAALWPAERRVRVPDPLADLDPVAPAVEPA